jgi:hypothetical protein
MTAQRKATNKLKVSADAETITVPTEGSTQTTTATVAHISPEIENILKVLSMQAGYVSIGIDTGGAAAIPATIIDKFKFDDNGATSDRLDGVFNFATVSNQRRIAWKNKDGKDEFSFVLENVEVTSGKETFFGSVPYAAYLQMVAAGNNAATFSLKRSANESKTRTYYSIRLTGLKA